MSQLRKRYRVAWDDREAVEVTTNAWDMSAAQDHQGDQMMQILAVVHHALEREGHLVPPLPKFGDVLDVLDMLDETGAAVTDPAQLDAGEAAGAAERPTQTGRGRGGRASSRS